MSASKNITSIWENVDISHYISLSLSAIEKNEPLVRAAPYFWSDAINAFIFNQGPFSPSLADVYMLTGLNIAFSGNSTFLDAKPSHKLTKKGI